MCGRDLLHRLDGRSRQTAFPAQQRDRFSLHSNPAAGQAGLSRAPTGSADRDEEGTSNQADAAGEEDEVGRDSTHVDN